MIPLFIVLSRPPPAVATQQVHGSASKTEMATIRPPMLAGPIDRQVSALSQSGPAAARRRLRRGTALAGALQLVELLLQLLELPLEILDLLLPGRRRLSVLADPLAS